MSKVIQFQSPHLARRSGIASATDTSAEIAHAKYNTLVRSTCEQHLMEQIEEATDTALAWQHFFLKQNDEYVQQFIELEAGPNESAKDTLCKLGAALDAAQTIAGVLMMEWMYSLRYAVARQLLHADDSPEAHTIADLLEDLDLAKYIQY